MTTRRFVCLLCRSYLLREQTSTISPPPPPRLARTAQEILQLSRSPSELLENGDEPSERDSQSRAVGERADSLHDAVFSSRLWKKRLHLLPPCRFPGETVHIQHPDKERDCTEEIRRLLRSHVLGFDVECWGTGPVPVLVQLASREQCVMWHVNKLESFPVLLHGILASPHYLKVGHGSSADARSLLRYHAINTINFFDTWDFLTSLPPDLQPPVLNLQGLVAVLLGGWLSKAMVRSNWSRKHLSEKQLLYASTDAWASLQVYLALMQYARELEITTPPPVECTLRTSKPELLELMEWTIRDNITQAEEARLAMGELQSVNGNLETCIPSSLEQFEQQQFVLECALKSNSDIV